MRTRVDSKLCLVALLVLASCAGAPADGDPDGGEAENASLDGAFTGFVFCENSEHTADALFSQEVGDDDIDGHILFDWTVNYVDGLINVNLVHTLRTSIVDGEVDDENVASGLLLSETVAPTANAPDFSFELSVYEPSETGGWNTLSGTLSQIDDDQEPVRTCDLVLARLGTALPAALLPSESDGGS